MSKDQKIEVDEIKEFLHVFLGSIPPLTSGGKKDSAKMLVVFLERFFELSDGILFLCENKKPQEAEVLFRTLLELSVRIIFIFQNLGDNVRLAREVNDYTRFELIKNSESMLKMREFSINVPNLKLKIDGKGLLSALQKSLKNEEKMRSEDEKICKKFQFANMLKNLDISEREKKVYAELYQLGNFKTHARNIDSQNLQSLKGYFVVKPKTQMDDDFRVLGNLGLWVDRFSQKLFYDCFKKEIPKKLEEASIITRFLKQ